MSFKDLMNKHLELYPKMETSDLIKLAYQSVYGPFHMENEENNLRNYLLNEKCNEIRKTEYLEGEYARYYFDNNTDLYLLLKLFIKSMQEHKNDDLFLDYLDLIEDKEGVNFYLQGGIRDIHHSKIYNELYKPHYRLIKKDYASYFDVLEKIGETIKNNPKAIIAIDGMCCSGKSYLAKLISSIYDVQIVHSDDFYLPKVKRSVDWFDIAGGNMNIDYLKDCLVRKEYKPFNCRNQSYGLKVKIEDKPIIVEGTYSLLVEDVYDLRIFLNCSNETQLKRLREREEDIKNFTDIWLVKEKAYFDKLDIKKKTDMIINTDKYF